VSGVVCVVCDFADDEILKNIHVDLASLVWGATLLSTHAPLTPWIHTPSSFIFSPFAPPPTCPLVFLFFLPRFLFGPFPFLFFLSSLTPPSYFFLSSVPCFWTLSTFFCLMCVCVYLRMYVLAYLAIQCASANDNAKHIKSNIRYVFYKKTNKMK